MAKINPADYSTPGEYLKAKRAAAGVTPKSFETIPDMLSKANPTLPSKPKTQAPVSFDDDAYIRALSMGGGYVGLTPNQQREVEEMARNAPTLRDYLGAPISSPNAGGKYSKYDALLREMENTKGALSKEQSDRVTAAQNELMRDVYGITFGQEVALPASDISDYETKQGYLRALDMIPKSGAGNRTRAAAESIAANMAGSMMLAGEAAVQGTKNAGAIWAMQREIEDANRRGDAAAIPLIYEKYKDQIDTPVSIEGDGGKLIGYSRDRQGKATYGLSDTEKFFMETGISTANYLGTLAMTGGNPAFALGLMGIQAGANQMYDAGEKGVDSYLRQVGSGIASGAIEALVERIPLGNLLKFAKSGGGSLADYAMGVLKQAGLEGGEEAVNYAAGVLANKLILGGYAEDFDVKEMLRAAAMGATSGGAIGAVMGAPASIYNARAEAAYSNTGRAWLQTNGNIDEKIAEGIASKNADANALARELLVQTRNGVQPSEADIGKLVLLLDGRFTSEDARRLEGVTPETKAAPAEETQTEVPSETQAETIPLQEAQISPVSEEIKDGVNVPSQEEMVETAEPAVTETAQNEEQIPEAAAEENAPAKQVQTEQTPASKASTYSEAVNAVKEEVRTYLSQPVKKGLTKNTHSEKLNRTERRTLAKVANSLGVEITIVDDIAPNAEGTVNGLYQNGHIVISSKSESPLETVLVHEITHHFERTAKEQYQTFQQLALSQIYGADLDYQAARITQNAKENGISEDLQRKEMAAEFTSDLLRDKNAIRRLMGEDMPLAIRFFRAIREVFDKVRAALGSEAGATATMLSEAEKLWQECFKEASANTHGLEMLGKDSVTQLSWTTWTTKERDAATNFLVKQGFKKDQIDRWTKDIDSVAAIIGKDRTRLDYEASPFHTMLKKNNEYFRTLDASTLCKKRLLFQGTFNRIVDTLDIPITSDYMLAIRAMLKEAGRESPCGICYVESRRRMLGDYTKRWMEEEYPKIKGKYPDVEISYRDLLNNERLEALRRDEKTKGIYTAYTKWIKGRGVANPKLVENRTEYRGDIRKLGKGTVEKIKRIGGLRIDSYSDFETPHLIDMMQAVVDMTAKGLTSQAYAKVGDFARVFGNTGIKINLSLIAKGIDTKGNLIYDDVEGIPHKEAFDLRSRFSKNVGTIVVCMNEEQVLAAMKDPKIDFIIPFHRSGWGEKNYGLLGLKGAKDFTDTQNERNTDGSKLDGNFYPSDYWDKDKNGTENAEIYLAKCKKAGRIPKFSQFLEYDAEQEIYKLPDDPNSPVRIGYWKTLIDFKMYDNDGVFAPQEVVTPTYTEENVKAIKAIMKEYEGGANSLPVAKEVVDRFVEMYRSGTLNGWIEEKNLSAEIPEEAIPQTSTSYIREQRMREMQKTKEAKLSGEIKAPAGQKKGVLREATVATGRWTAARTGDADTKAKSLSEIVNQIRKDFGVNITAGHVRGANTLGTYNLTNKGIRSKAINNLPTIAHELGHFIDDKYGLIRGDIPARVKAELEDALGEKKTAYPKRLWATEGFAEYFRKYLQNSEKASNEYPAITEYFKKGISGKELAQIEALADDVNAYFAIGSQTAEGAIRVTGKSKIEWLKENVNIDRLRVAAPMLYRAFVSSNNGIKRFDREYGTNTYMYAINSAYSDAMAGQIIEGDLTDANGKFVAEGLSSVLSGINLSDKSNEYLAFGEYLVVKHGPERLAEGKDVFANDEQNTLAFMKKRQKELEEQYPHFAETSEKLYKFQRTFLYTWGVKTGLVSKESFDEWGERWKFYVPFNRAMDDSKARPSSAKRGYVNQDSTIRRAKGSKRDIIHPVDNIIHNIVTMVNAGVRNDVMIRITDAAERMGANATFLEKIPPKMRRQTIDISSVMENLLDMLEDVEMDTSTRVRVTETITGMDVFLNQFRKAKMRDGNEITVMKGGKPEYWKINDSELLESVTGMMPRTQSGLLEAMGVLSKFMTANITGLNFLWSLFSNLPRDLVTMTVYSKNKTLKLFPAMGSAYLNKFKSEFGGDVDPLYKEYLAMGGGQNGVYSADINLAKKAVKSFYEKSQKGLKAKVKSTLSHPIRSISFLTDLLEAGPRFATYKVLRESGASPALAFYEAMDITTNFRRTGEISRQINQVVPFFNASVQGLDKFARWITAEDAPKGMRGKKAKGRIICFVAVSVAAAAMLYAVNNGDDEREKDYERLSTFTKNTYWVIPIGGGKFFTIPKPREIAVLSSLTETILERTLGGNTHAFDEFYEYFTDQCMPPIVSEIAKFPTRSGSETIGAVLGDLGMIGVGGQIWANRDFLGRPIVSAGLEQLLPKDQYTAKTSRIAKELGVLFNASPQKIDYFFQNILGGFWKANRALFPVDPNSRDLTLGVEGSYIKDSLYSTDIVNWLYDKAEQSDKESNSDGANADKAYIAKRDSNMKTFYSRYYGLSKGTDDELSRVLRETVLEMILEYQKASDSGAMTSAENTLYLVCTARNETDIMPQVMSTTVKSGDIKYELSAEEYVEYQTLYNTYYWEGVEAVKTGKITSEADAERRHAQIKESKSAAKKKATEEIIKILKRNRKK